MAGIGGLFPNFEDHLLDKKKISEFFKGNIHEIYYPINYTSKTGPWQYHISADVGNFLDPSTLTWNGRIKVINKEDGSAVTDANNINLSLIHI